MSAERIINSFSMCDIQVANSDAIVIIIETTKFLFLPQLMMS